MRARTVLIGGGTALVLASLLMTDPDGGMATGLGLLAVASGVIKVAFAHLARRGLFDYLDLQRVAEKAQQTPLGAGLVFVGVCLVISALLGLFGRAHAQGHVQERAQPVPARALPLLPVLAAEIDTHWPTVPLRHYLPGLVEHESCITLQHSRCWQPTAQLRTAREEGAGLGQITRAWRPDGTLRFDALAELRAQHPALAELTWQTVYSNPRLQLRALVLQSRGNYTALRAVADPLQRLAMADAAYNGGLGGLQQERRACGLRTGCDAQQWWGHVELHCLKSRAPLYAGRSACDINRHHVHDVLRVRAPRYLGLV
jgi:hypothetical protein